MAVDRFPERLNAIARRIWAKKWVNTMSEVAVKLRRSSVQFSRRSSVQSKSGKRLLVKREHTIGKIAKLPVISGKQTLMASERHAERRIVRVVAGGIISWKFGVEVTVHLDVLGGLTADWRVFGNRVGWRIAGEAESRQINYGFELAYAVSGEREREKKKVTKV